MPGTDPPTFTPESDRPPLHITLPSPAAALLSSPNPSPQHQSPSLNHPPTTHADQPLSPHLDETYPDPVSPPPQLPFDDDALSTLEKIYLFSRSKATYHRVFITHALPSLLDQVTPTEAIDYVLPLLSALAMDDGMSTLCALLFQPYNIGPDPDDTAVDDQVKEALVSELLKIIWWFVTVSNL